MRSSILAVASALLVYGVACGPKVDPVVASPPVHCSAFNNEERPRMNCAAEFQLDSTNISGAVKAFNFGIEGKSETVPARQVSESLMGYAFQRRDLCEQWNSCAISQADFSTRSENLRRVLNKVPLLKDQAEAAEKSGDSAQKAKAAQEVQSAVDDAVRFELELTARVMLPADMSKVPAHPCPPALKDSERFELQPAKLLANGDTLPDGARIFFKVKTTRPVHMYLFQRKESGALNSIFPDAQLAVKNPVQPGAEIEIPPDPATYCVDENDRGTERIFIVMSSARLENLDAAIAEIDKGNVKTIAQSPPALRAMDAIDKPAPPGCNSRGVVIDPGPQAKAAQSNACPPRSRGVVIDTQGRAAGASAKTSLHAKSEPGDAMIVQVFSFKHVAAADFKP